MTRYIGPTKLEYKSLRPWVDWSTHEVYYRKLGSYRGMHGRDLIMEIQSHGRKFNYNALYDDLDRADGAPSGTNWRLDNSLDGKVTKHWRSPNRVKEVPRDRFERARRAP